jgi:hypothetical protein
MRVEKLLYKIVKVVALSPPRDHALLGLAASTEALPLKRLDLPM